MSDIPNLSRVTTLMYTTWQVNTGGIAASPVSLGCSFLVWRHSPFNYKGFFIILVENPSGDNEYGGLFICFPMRLMFTSFVSSWFLAPWQSCSSVPCKAYENVVVLVFWRAHHESRNQDCFSELENNQNCSCFYCHFVFSVSGVVRTFWILSRGMMLADLPAFWDANSK